MEEQDVVFADVEKAARRVADIARRTPVLSSRSVSERVGGHVVLKAENLQRTGSFKLRGRSTSCGPACG